MDLRLRRPLPDGIGRISQSFGANPDNYRDYGLAGHEGLDYECPLGTPILAAHDGVAQIKDEGPYGLHVIVTAPHMQTVYAHLSSVKVKPGAGTLAGDELGLSGSSGRSTGPHLHFGCRITGVCNPAYQDFVDPLIGRILNGDA